MNVLLRVNIAYFAFFAHSPGLITPTRCQTNSCPTGGPGSVNWTLVNNSRAFTFVFALDFTHK